MENKLIKIPDNWEELKSLIKILPHCGGKSTRFLKDKEFYESHTASLTIEEKINNIYKRMGGSEVCLLLNNYPYTRILKKLPDVIHYCLWSRKGALLPKIVNQKIIEEFPGHDFFWFENDNSIKSIPEIWHCHVFIKM